MENHYFQWVNPLFLWPFSIAMLNNQRVIKDKPWICFWFLQVGSLGQVQMGRSMVRGKNCHSSHVMGMLMMGICLSLSMNWSSLITIPQYGYIYIYLDMVQMCISVYVCIYRHIQYICICICICNYMYMIIWIYVYVYVYNVYIYICICTHTLHMSSPETWTNFNL